MGSELENRNALKCIHFALTPSFSLFPDFTHKTWHGRICKAVLPLSDVLALFCFIQKSQGIVNSRSHKPTEPFGSDTARALFVNKAWLKSPPGSSASPVFCQVFPVQTWGLRASQLPQEHSLACAGPQGRAHCWGQPRAVAQPALAPDGTS